MNSLLIGCGNLGEVILRGLLKKKKKIFVLEKNKKILNKLRKKYSKTTFFEKIDSIDWNNIDYLMICIKPKHTKKLLQEIRNIYKNHHIIISFVAGLETKIIENNVFKKCKVVRLMPNIFISSNNSATAIFTKNINRNVKIEILKEFQHFGESIIVNDEKKFNFFTAMFGGGPAYLFFILECFNKLIIKQGFKKKESSLLLSSLLLGATRLLQSGNINYDKLIEKVASKGGTTEEALKVFRKNSVLFKVIKEAINAATKKSNKISKLLN